MRRNVRRLNREVGGVVVAVSGAGRAKGLGAAETGEFDIEDGSKKPRVNATKKAANLSELKRYCKAAEEAAREVLIEAQNESGAAAANPEIAAAVEATSMDVRTLANLQDTLPLKSPSRMVALQLANGNPNFRERLKKKLEESGVTFEMDDAAGVLVGFGAQPPPRGSRGSTMKNGKPPLSGEYDGAQGGAKGNGNKMRQKRKASAFDDDDGSKASIIRRRRKTDLQISVNGTAAQIHAGQMQMAPPNGTPYRGYGYVQGVHGVSPLNVDGQNLYGDDLYNNGLGSLGGLIGIPISDTPGKPFVNNGEACSGSSSTAPGGTGSTGSTGTPKFDFDEVVQHFPSPRAGGMLGSSPSRWSIGSAGSSSSFAFPDSNGKMRDSMGSMPPGSDGKGLRDGIYMQMASNSTSKILRRQSGMSDVSDADGFQTRLPSPMSALPSPTFADISVSFLNAQQQLERGGGGGSNMQSPIVKSSSNSSSMDDSTNAAIVSSDDVNKSGSGDSISGESADGSTSGLST